MSIFRVVLSSIQTLTTTQPPHGRNLEGSLAIPNPRGQTKPRCSLQPLSFRVISAGCIGHYRFISCVFDMGSGQIIYMCHR
ncbi:hypothetical protein OPQ81_004932 [Rhizoctonia solani]|nr:hypothetical protein OPQ81_004932 [Rhizoctonia solani]